MKNLIKLTVVSTLLAAVFAAPQKDRQEQLDESPLAAIGSFIQRLQTSFAEGQGSIGQPQGNAYSLSLTAKEKEKPIPTTTTPPPPPTTTRKQGKNAFDSINAILDNIRNSPNSNRIDDDDDDYNRSNKNNVFGNVPGRQLNFPIQTTPPPFFFQPTSKPPFSIDGISQGINAFFQTFLKTNIDKIFKPQQDHLKRDIEPRVDDQPNKVPSLIDIFLNGLFRKS